MGLAINTRIQMSEILFIVKYKYTIFDICIRWLICIFQKKLSKFQDFKIIDFVDKETFFFKKFSFNSNFCTTTKFKQSIFISVCIPDNLNLFKSSRQVKTLMHVLPTQYKHYYSFNSPVVDQIF